MTHKKEPEHRKPDPVGTIVVLAIVVVVVVPILYLVFTGKF